MKNFYKWNSELLIDQQIPRELEHLGEMVWDACATECAKLCRDMVKAQEGTDSLPTSVWSSVRCTKVLEDLGNNIEDH